MNRRTCLKVILGGAVLPRICFGGKLTGDAGNLFVVPPGGTLPDDEVRILGGYLHRYVPPQGLIPPEGGWSILYDLIDVTLPEKAGASVALSNSILGTVAIRRDLGSSEYHIQMNFHPAGSVEEVSATIHCNPDDLFSIRDYELDWTFSGVNRPYVRHEAGLVQPGGLRVSSGGSSDVVKIGNPLTTLWSMMDAVRCLPPSGGWSRRFDMYMDLSSLRRNQTLQYARSTGIRTAAGLLPVHLYEQTGTGIQPIHYAVDEMQRILFVTQGQLGWALNRIERV